MTPYVSVILPTYNRPNLLRRSLNTIAAQTFEDFECIVVNDAGEPVDEIVSEYPFAQLITHDVNGGLSAARNSGLYLAQGKYIAYQDDDDIWFPEHLSVLVEHLDTLPDIRAAYTDCYRWYNEEYLFAGKDRKKNGRNVAAIICLMHERALLDEVGYFDEDLRCMEDWDFLIRMSRHCGIFHIPRFTAAYSKRGADDQLSYQKEAMQRAYDTIQSRHGVSPPKYDLEMI